MNVFLNGYCDCNFGDDLMMLYVYKNLKENGHSVFMASKDPYVFNRLKEQFIDVIFLDNDSSEILQKNSIDAYVEVGGSMFPHDTLKEGIYRYGTLSKYLKYKNKGIKLCIVNCSISWPKIKCGIRATNKILKIADFISTRDRTSFEYIKKYNNKVSYFPDILFFPLTDEPNKEKSQNKILGISAYMAYKSSERKINTSIFGYLSSVIEEYLKKEKIEKIYLFSFDGGYNSDLPMAFYLKNKFINSNKIEIISYQGDIQNFVDKLKMCSYYVGIRFHSVVYCIANHISFSPVVYERKTESLLKELGIYDEIMDIKKGYPNMNLYTIENTTIQDYIDKSKGHITALLKYLNGNNEKGKK